MLAEIASGRVALEGQWHVVALSMKSPVVVALARVLKELGGAGDLQVRVLLTAQSIHAVGDEFQNVGELAVRVTQTSRMLDAHEQLVMGPVSSWVGDCMRRDPCERDAFETFGGDSAQLAAWGQRSFDRMWGCGKPVSALCRRNIRASNIEQVVAGEQTAANTPVLVAATSRH